MNNHPYKGPKVVDPLPDGSINHTVLFRWSEKVGEWVVSCCDRERLAHIGWATCCRRCGWPWDDTVHAQGLTTDH